MSAPTTTTKRVAKKKFIWRIRLRAQFGKRIRIQVARVRTWKEACREMSRMFNDSAGFGYITIRMEREK